MLLTKRKTVGRSEVMKLPDLGMFNIPAKTDTGAYRSAIHAENIKIVNEAGKVYLVADIMSHHPSVKQNHSYKTENFKEVTIENSFGHREKRYEIRLKTVVAGRKFTTSFTLADRSKKPYPVLMGRKLLNKRFLVDTSISIINRVDLKKNHIALPLDEELLYNKEI